MVDGSRHNVMVEPHHVIVMVNTPDNWCWAMFSCVDDDVTIESSSLNWDSETNRLECMEAIAEASPNSWAVPGIDGMVRLDGEHPSFFMLDDRCRRVRVLDVPQSLVSVLKRSHSTMGVQARVARELFIKTIRLACFGVPADKLRLALPRHSNLFDCISALHSAIDAFAEHTFHAY